MKKACNLWATGKGIWFLLLQLIILRRLVAESSDFCENLSTICKEIKMDGKNSNTAYYKWQLSVVQCYLREEKSKLDEQVGWDRSGKEKYKQYTYLVFSHRSEKISSNLNSKLNTMINFNEKNCVKIVSFYNKLRLDLNGEERKLEKRESRKISNNEWRKRSSRGLLSIETASSGEKARWKNASNLGRKTPMSYQKNFFTAQEQPGLP